MNETNKKHFIAEEIEKDLAGRLNELVTRFPPEPNGYLHVGHAKSIFLNFGIAKHYGGHCNMRFDDTNPEKEDTEYVDSILEDVKWLIGKGLDLDMGAVYFASDYFEKFYEFAVGLVKKGLAYVCDLDADQMNDYRGSFTETGKNSPYRDRSIEENLQLFADMRAGKFTNGEKTLRAKIDMASPNITLRDPVIYRINHTAHHNTGDAWCIYPMYDFAHPLEDAIEGVTHSLCTLEFVNNRPIYDWYINNCEVAKKPRQIEFGKLNLTRTILGKRYITQLVNEGKVSGWDDPRLMTLKGMRRRGYTPTIIKKFCDQAGLSKADGNIDIAELEAVIRDDLKSQSQLIMAVIDPIKVVITNYPINQNETLEIENNAENETMGKRHLSFGRELYIEAQDFMEEPDKKFHRLAPGKEVRLKGAYFIKCEEVIKDESGNITQLNCTYDIETKSGSGFTGRKVKGTIHWVHAATCVQENVHFFNYLVDEAGEFNEHSWITKKAYIEENITELTASHFQFLRHGYFVKDTQTGYNCLVSLKSSY